MPYRNSQEAAAIILADILAALTLTDARPQVVGISGAQGSGKTTIARHLAAGAQERGLRATTLSLDDFYFSRAERRRIAAATNPLFVTRGAPGTHDVALAQRVIGALKNGLAAPAPVFEKARDEPLARADWPIVPAGLDLVVFEGWCLGARPQGQDSLTAPINTFERAFDSDGGWRRAVNESLGGAYQSLFAMIDRLVFLRAPTFEIVLRWRTEQERALAAAPRMRPSPGLMTAEEISFFIQHFERITRWMMEETPGRADLTLHLDDHRRVLRTEGKRAPSH